ncbi:MAG TPA: D-alanine--D-alanine ligase A, partial [Bacillota bacterium]|nr:D-alanine--D-alanine ligase A [Bacillota bacterium]
FSESKTEEIREAAIKAYKALDCCGMARADFLVDKETEKVYINELNTIPGFTKISMYPKLWDAAGLSYGKLIDRLIELAIDRYNENNGNV